MLIITVEVSFVGVAILIIYNQGKKRILSGLNFKHT